MYQQGLPDAADPAVTRAQLPNPLSHLQSASTPRLSTVTADRSRPAWSPIASALARTPHRESVAPNNHVCCSAPARNAIVAGTAVQESTGHGGEGMPAQSLTPSGSTRARISPDSLSTCASRSLSAASFSLSRAARADASSLSIFCTTPKKHSGQGVSQSTPLPRVPDTSTRTGTAQTRS